MSQDEIYILLTQGKDYVAFDRATEEIIILINGKGVKMNYKEWHKLYFYTIPAESQSPPNKSMHATNDGA